MTRRPRTMLLAISLATSLAAPAGAQTSALGPRARSLEEGRRLADAGEVGAARVLADSLARATPPDAVEFPQILFLRASVAASVLDADLDYDKIVSTFPAAGVRRESLLRLAQRAIIAGDALKALAHLQTLSRDYQDDTSRALAEYWKARALLESQEVGAACVANREALARAKASSSPLRPDIETQGRVSCGQAPLTGLVEAPPIVTATSRATAATTGAGGKTYAVQVSAFATLQEAEAMATRLKQGGMNAHVDGKTRPFRVRIGYFATFAEAAKALRELKSRRMSGFVAEMSP